MPPYAILLYNILPYFINIYYKYGKEILFLIKYNNTKIQGMDNYERKYSNWKDF